jgi:oligoendopeptidase F
VSQSWLGASSLESNFYNFQYLPGFAVGANLSDRLAGGTTTAERIMTMLEAGTSLDPAATLALVGIHLNDPSLLDSGFATLEARARRLAWLS